MTMFRVAIVATGSELLRGEIVDTNSTFLQQEFFQSGVFVHEVVVVPDDRNHIARAIRFALMQSDLIVVTGGLGPTTDDITRDAIADVCEVSLYKDDNALKKLVDLLEKRGRTLTSINERQCYFPVGAHIFVNDIGTADAFVVKTKDGKNIISLPGVPREMKKLFTEQITTWAQDEYSFVRERSTLCFKVFGLTESLIGNIIEECQLPASIYVSYRAAFPLVQVMLIGPNDNNELSEAYKKVSLRLGADHIFTKEPRESLAANVGRLLQDKNMTFAVAESCTGGELASQVVSQAGASQYFLGSYVVYSNQLKIKALGVRPETLEAYGAVSKETAIELVEGIFTRTGASVALSITGIAGPDGGTEEKPVGTVWLGLAIDGKAEAYCYRYIQERNMFRTYISHLGLDLVRRKLLGLEPTGDMRIE